MELNSSSHTEAGFYAVRVAVGICSSISILGACAIILSYAAFPELRTVARQLLLNISIADIILSLAFILGLIQNAGSIEDPYTNNNGSVPYWLCEAQAFGIILATDAIILWTIAIGVYFFVTIAMQKPKHAKRLVPAFYMISWGVSLSVVLWLLLTNSLGFEPGSDPAFCSILSTVVMDGKRVDADYPILAGNLAWNYLAFVVLPILFISTLCRNRQLEKMETKMNDTTSLVSSETSSNGTSSTSSNSSHLYKIKLSEMADKRVVIVPVVYMLLKFWGIAVDVGIYFLPTHAKTNYQENTLSLVLIFLSGIGSSITGFVHGLLFCVLTKEVRGTMLKGLWNGLISCEHCIYDRTFMCCKTKHSDHVHPLDDKTQLSDPNAFREMLDPASSEYSVMSEYDIIQSPDPTTSVSITQIPGPRFAQHFEDERENS